MGFTGCLVQLEYKVGRWGLGYLCDRSIEYSLTAGNRYAIRHTKILAQIECAKASTPLISHVSRRSQLGLEEKRRKSSEFYNFLGPGDATVSELSNFPNSGDARVPTFLKSRIQAHGGNRERNVMPQPRYYPYASGGGKFCLFYLFSSAPPNHFESAGRNTRSVVAVTFRDGCVKHAPRNLGDAKPSWRDAFSFLADFNEFQRFKTCDFDAFRIHEPQE
ncbi:hypothetical protein RRG08_012801 [Elysia crispata]|uniref:Uncharacterized protein n=1 Tax=Elysia crispata TaxID=231223 RepID=A0AAE0Z2Y7_9GAST|nr:hypothetical protein RRG08_012801 [Elysia crispata]